MTHEQKPESAEFRTREELEALASGYISRHHLPDCWADVGEMIDEMMAAGAAEQRRKDAEGAELVAWCLMTADGQIINGIHEEKHQAETYRHRKASDTLTPLYTRPANVAALIADAVAAERKRCVEIVRKHGISPFPIDDPNPNAEEINATLQNITAAIREGGEHG